MGVAMRALVPTCLYGCILCSLYYSYAISRLDRCEGLLQEWATYVQSAGATARAMDEVPSLVLDFTPHAFLQPCARSQQSTRRARLLSFASFRLRSSVLATWTP